MVGGVATAWLSNHAERTRAGDYLKYSLPHNACEGRRTGATIRPLESPRAKNAVHDGDGERQDL